jgi:hypothetical protein
VRVADPVGFTNAFGKLEQAIRELVGAGDVKERLEVATMALMRISSPTTSQQATYATNTPTSARR